jgi:hypothetical protein
VRRRLRWLLLLLLLSPLCHHAMCATVLAAICPWYACSRQDLVDDDGMGGGA